MSDSLIIAYVRFLILLIELKKLLSQDQSSYNKSQRDALYLKIIFDKELYMFRKDLLSNIRSLNTA